MPLAQLPPQPRRPVWGFGVKLIQKQNNPLFEKRHFVSSSSFLPEEILGLSPSIIRFNFRNNSSWRYRGHRDQGLMDPSLPLILIPPQICPADVLTHTKDPPYVIHLCTAEVNGPFWIPGAPVSDIQTISLWCLKLQGWILLTSVLFFCWLRKSYVYCMHGWAY